MNNNNKYYLIQLLEDNNAKKYYVWQRWGRGNFLFQVTINVIIALLIKFRLFSQVLIKILKMSFFTFSWIHWAK